jgi:hypothetical protein
MKSMADETDQQARELVALRAQRDALDRELVRKSFRIGELEQMLFDNALVYEESLSWKLTRPVRGARTLVGRLLRG